MKGTRDHTPQAWRRMSAIHQRLETFLDRRGYDVVSTPLLEQTELFLRKSGGELASKMYSFTDPSGRRVSLRPEFTSSVVRAYVGGTFNGQLPHRWQYYGSVFRYEGASDDDGGDAANEGFEFQQLGAELMGAGAPAADAEVVALAVQGLTALGVRGLSLRVGHVGVVNAMLDALGLSERARVFVLGNLQTLKGGSTGAVQALERAEEMGLLGPSRSRKLTGLARRLDDEEAEGMVQGSPR